MRISARDDGLLIGRAWVLSKAGTAGAAHRGRSCHRPSCSRRPAQAEHAQPGEVDRGSQQAEVRGNLGPAAHTGTAAAVAAAHEMAKFSFDLGTGGAVVGQPGGLGLAGPGGGKQGLMRADGDGATALGAGALAGQRTDNASRAERRLAGVPLGWWWGGSPR